MTLGQTQKIGQSVDERIELVLGESKTMQGESRTVQGKSRTAQGENKTVQGESKKTNETALVESRMTSKTVQGESRKTNETALVESRITNETAVGDCKKIFVGCARGLWLATTSTEHDKTRKLIYTTL